MENQVIRANLINDILYPHPQGLCEVHVTYQMTPEGRTALIAFGGNNRAIVYFSSAGDKAISHTSLGMEDTLENQQSVQNIVAILN